MDMVLHLTFFFSTSSEPTFFSWYACVQLELLSVQLFFPIVRGQHWVLTCINMFLKQINFFNSINASTLTPCYESSNNLVITSCPFVLFHDYFFFSRFSMLQPSFFIPFRLQTFQRLQWNWEFLKRMCPSVHTTILQSTPNNIHCMFFVHQIIIHMKHG
jgi:hypothetical protein